MKNNNKQLLFIFITILIDCLGIGIIIPVVPALIQSLGNCTVSEASRIGGTLLVAYSVMQFIFSPVLGGLSDKFGRRPILLISLFGLGVDFLFTAFAPSISWLFIGRIIAGICGASFTSASAYIADISTQEDRAKNFGLVGAAFGVGFILGPLIGTFLSTISIKAPFIGAAVFSLLNFLYGIFVLPESLSKENRREFDWKRANPLGTFKQLFKHKGLIGLLVALFLLYVAGKSVETIWLYYNSYKFHWSDFENGMSITFVGISVAIVQGGLIRLIVPKLGQKRTILVGMMLYALGLILFAIATKGYMMYLFLLPYALAGICGPSLQGVISSQVAKDEQGELQGGITSLMSLASIIGPLIMTNIFYAFTNPNAKIVYPGAAFVLAAFLSLIALGISYNALKKLDLKN